MSRMCCVACVSPMDAQYPSDAYLVSSAFWFGDHRISNTSSASSLTNASTSIICQFSFKTALIPQCFTSIITIGIRMLIQPFRTFCTCLEFVHNIHLDAAINEGGSLTLAQSIQFHGNSLFHFKFLLLQLQAICLWTQLLMQISVVQNQCQQSWQCDPTIQPGPI